MSKRSPTPMGTPFAQHAEDSFRLLEKGARNEQDISAAILASLPGVYYMYDTEGRFVRWNHLFEVVTGLSGEEIRNTHPLDLFAEEDRARVAERIEEVFRIGHSEVEADFVAADGSRTPYYFNGVRAEFDGKQYLLGMGIDISTQRMANDELERTNDLLRAVAEGVPDAIYVKDREGKYLFMNPAAARFVGRTVGQVIGRSDTDFFEAADAARIMDWDRTVMASNATDVREAESTAAGVRRTFVGTKSPYHDADGNVIGVFGISRDVSEQKESAALLKLRDRAVQAVSQGILIADPNQPDNPIIFANAGFERMTGYDSSELLGRNCRLLYGEGTDPEVVARLQAAMNAGKSCTVEFVNYRKDGSSFLNQLAMSPVLGPDGQVTHFVGVQNDITEQRRLEEQYRQSQKMDAVGQLAAGVAHDFNNLLTIINGYTQVLLANRQFDEPARELLSEIYKAGDRAGTLTRQLLAFSRQQVLEPREVNINDVVRDTERMLHRLIGEDVLLVTKLSTTLGHVKVDPGQIEQVLINLSVNARDAMPTGGHLTIETQSIEIDELHVAASPALPPGQYTLLVVSDTGCGIEEALRPRIFEPFFTTKEAGKGTGLGLATVHGIVKQSRGHIALSSEVGWGTTFKIYLPNISGPPKQRSSGEQGLRAMPAGTETILLVEDDDSVRALSRHILTRVGYRVIEASDGLDALRVAANEEGTIDLLISDVVMPHLGGRALAEQLTVIRPDTKVLFTSGYTDDAVLRHGVLEEDFAFLQKPFSPSALTQKVRTVLDESKRAATD